VTSASNSTTLRTGDNTAGLLSGVGGVVLGFVVLDFVVFRFVRAGIVVTPDKVS